MERFALKHIEEQHFDVSGEKMGAQLRDLERMVKTGKFERRSKEEVKAEMERLRTGIDHLKAARDAEADDAKDISFGCKPFDRRGEWIHDGSESIKRTGMWMVW